MSRVALTAVAACAAAACAAQSHSRPLSVADHRAEASRERIEADQDYARFRPGATGSLPGAYAGPGEPRLYPLDMLSFNSTERALDDAERHLRHAREHEVAATELERYEEVECRAFGPHTRAACPVLGPVTRIEDTADGVRIYFADDAEARAMAALMRCHLAFAQARGFRDAGDCPLYLPAIEIVATGGAAVEVRSADAAVAQKIRARSRLTSLPPR